MMRMTDGLDWGAIEAGCHRRWADSGAFEAEPDDAMPDKRFITVAYPYPNSPQHIGHGRTYTLADVHARFHRLKGRNVLFPMGFHYTGTPILGMAKRVQEGDAEIIRNLRDIYGIPEQAISKFADPLSIARYFHNEIKSGMREMGYSIDWRREFTTVDPAYSRFIEWQITMLRRKGLIIRGSHPVGWCPKDQNPVSQHDTLGDVEPGFTEYVMIKFDVDGYVVPVATLRPETVFGVTNLWVNPGIRYKRITVSGRKWIVSGECAYRLEFLGRDVSYEGEIAGSDLVGLEAAVPHEPGRRIPVLPARFVESGTGTGIVMSVPAHAPYDLQALHDLAGGGGLPDRPSLRGPATGAAAVADTAAAVKPIRIIATGGYGEIPAGDAIARAAPGCADQNDPRLEAATKELYSKEFYEGTMAMQKDEWAAVGGRVEDGTDGSGSETGAGRFDGRPVREARDAVGAWLVDAGHAEQLLEIADAPVRCRCGAECVVKILNDQWFLNYGDPEWKRSAHECLDGMEILPDEIRQEFAHVVDWLHERACARQHGLGTSLPWDPDWIVESLSDSVIYMAYYTISRFVNDGTIRPDQMQPEFFDYVLRGVRGGGENGGGGDKEAEAVSTWRAKSVIPEDTLRMIRREFEYFYPVDYRHSGRDLVPNHLTFFVLNHVALFGRDGWPRGIVVNGSVLMDGSKMSKSMGNIVPLREAVRRYGADPIRLAIITSAELLQDADFNMESVHGMRARLEAMHAECVRLGARGAGGAGGTAPPAKAGAAQAAATKVQAAAAASPPTIPAEDAWLLSKTRQIIISAEGAIEKMRLREALHLILFEMESVLSWHARRTEAKGRPARDISGILHGVMTARVTMLQPFAPHVTESMWAALGHGQDSWAENRWPGAAAESVDKTVLQAEHLLRSTLDDIASIIKVTKISPSRITIYVTDDDDGDGDGARRDGASLKRSIYGGVMRAVADEETAMGGVMRRLLADPSTSGAKQMPNLVQLAIKDILSDPVWVREARLAAVSASAASDRFSEYAFLAAELPCMSRAVFGAELTVFPESGSGIYDPRSKARHARPFKPAILIE